MNTMQDYGPGTLIGAGAFGTVTAHKKGNTRYAIKTVITDRSFQSREADLCTFLMDNPSQNIVRIFEVHQKGTLSVVMELVRYSLHDVLNRLDKAGLRMKEHRAKSTICDIACGLQHLHTNGIAHRDIKPQHILTDAVANISRICDFGSAKHLSETNTTYICSRYYRAPELILDRPYTKMIDVWSLGCVAAEICGIDPLFQGDSNVEQLCAIIKVKGTPSTSDMDIIDDTGGLRSVKIKHVKGVPLSKVLCSRLANGRTVSLSYGHSYESLIQWLLSWAPVNRPNASEVLTHHFLNT